MKIEVTHVIKADSQIVSLFNAFLGAIGAPSDNLSVANAVDINQTATSAPTNNEASTKATKRTYLFHEESGAVLVVNKGEELDKHLDQGLVEISKAEYDRIQVEKQARIDKAKDEADSKDKTAETTETESSKDHGITIEMVRAEAKKLTSNGRQADFKAILESFEAPKLTAVPEAKYPELLAAIKEAVGEE
ncbi:hypothetical protein LAV73_06780 [Lysinibacillus xylanilyticus]|uniref:hypothetical protein n=1 Tax=Lysinibacillus xylanilyticus TaxID=582475 RepID=UPI002B251822|nr:hypothetical protein [Lysinibacillus xylanilyticus]MEB2279705.1 hypothetical protein [Lysinibacillus xylanilyticus]